jgi:anti-sigma factor RsiW
MKNFRDIENLSAYLDGQLSQTESAKIKLRLDSDAELASVLSDLRSARNILNKLPKRKSPKNFTLTRQMVGLKPPLPRTYPLFRLATIFATVLFVFSFSINALSPYTNKLSASSPAFGFGGGGAGAPLMEAPAATEEAMAQPLDTANSQPTPTAKQANPEESFAQDSVPAVPSEPQIQNEAFQIPSAWVNGFLIISISGALILFVINQNAKRKWQ